MSNTHINDEKLARLELHILAGGYKPSSRITEVLIEEDNQIEDEVVEEPEVSDFEEKKKKQKVQREV